MPSVEHDTLNMLFRNRPAFALEVLRDLFDVDVPEHACVEVAPADFNDRPSRDCVADTVVIVGPSYERSFAAIIEPQLKIEPSKLTSWPRYAAALWLREDCEIEVLAICPDAKVAAWASQPIPTKLPGYALRVRVIGPDQIPIITDVARAMESPELSALSVMAHGHRREVAMTFMTALEKVPHEHAPYYYEYAHRLSPLTVRRILEELMTSTAWPVYSPFAREHFGKGKVEGLAEGEAKAVLSVFQARGITVTDEARARIMTCTDVDQLDEWVRRAVTAATVEELFDGE
jgi:hypothetical protein